MMEVFIDADGESLFLNDIQVQETSTFPPFLRFIGSRIPRKRDDNSFETYKERLARKHQQAIAMTYEQEQSRL